MDNEIFKNWWKKDKEIIDPLENAFVVNYPSTTIPYHNCNNTASIEIKPQDYETVDIRAEAISQLLKDIKEIYKSLADHEKRIGKLENEKS